MTTDTIPLSPRHERFVLELLKDGNATQAYIRAGYSPRGAQPSASKLLRRPQIEAAVAAGRQRMAQALEVDVQRIAREYAKIAFASFDDFVSVDADGRLRIDLMKAGQAQRDGIVELRIANHRNQQQTVTLKLGKLQALAALVKQIGVLVEKPAPGLTPEDRQRYEERCAGYERLLDHRKREQDRLKEELHTTRQALAGVEARKSGIENPNPPIFPLRRQQDEPVRDAAAAVEAPGPAAPPPRTDRERAFDNRKSEQRRLREEPHEARTTIADDGSIAMSPDETYADTFEDPLDASPEVREAPPRPPIVFAWPAEPDPSGLPIR